MTETPQHIRPKVTHPKAKWIDYTETYGANVIERMVRAIPRIDKVVDIGAGLGFDLGIVKAAHPECMAIGVEMSTECLPQLTRVADEVIALNIESEPLPFADSSIDLMMANQVLEHTKEVFWIFHEVSRSLKPGGHFIFGVPNVLSFHNRLLGMVGRHPTQHKLASAHVRPFSKRDTVEFVNACSPGTYSLKAFGGSQFYPLPMPLSRISANLLPSWAFSIFFCFQKIGPYEDGFVRYPITEQLETNFYLGSRQ
jgi:SAM-dependent methyltransferase